MSTHPDLWRSQDGSRPTVLSDMVEGPMPPGLLGAGDPDVHLIDGQWTMFLGGFSTTFRNRLYSASLVDNATGPSGQWRFDLDARGRARALAADPPKGAWDTAGLHTPSYVPPAGGNGARIYYTGRATSKHYGPKSSYSIGVLEYRDGRWHRHEKPILEGVSPRHSVLEPFVIHADGRYRMWYQANPHEIGPGEQPDYELRTTESVDGLTDWTPPRVFSDSSEGFFDNALARGGQGWVMVLARGSNLHNTADFPAQGLWWVTAPYPSADRADWSQPQRLLDTDHPDTPLWMARGVYGPALAFDSPTSTRATVFVTGTRATPPWPRLLLGRLANGHRPPVPAPFYLSTASLTVDLSELPDQAER